MDQRHKARRRWGNFVNSVGQGRSAELLRGGVACPTGLAGANGVVDGGRSFSGLNCPWSPAGSLSLGVVWLKTDAPHGVKRAGFSQNVGASVVLWSSSVKTW